jgi:hypothetical protein
MLGYNKSGTHIVDFITERLFARMRRWGWRWLFCWLSVLVTACGQLSSPTPTPKPATRTPSLQGFTPQATAPPTLPVRPIYTLTPFSSIATRLVSQDLFSSVRVEPPTCYESAVQSLVCLGWVQNTSDDAFINPLITVYLLTTQGQPIAFLDAPAALSLLSAGMGSPYRVIFREIPTEEWVVHGELRSVEPLVINSLPAVLDLPVANVETTWEGAEYLIQGEVVNDTGATLNSVRVLVSFTDERGQVTGFRSQELIPDEPAIRKMDFSFKAAPLTGKPTDVRVMAQGYVAR